METANAAARAKGTYLRDKFYRLKARRGYKRAVVTVAHKILAAIYHMLSHVDRIGTFLGPLAITAVVLITGCLSWVFVVGRVEQVNWKSEQRGTPVAATTLES